MGMGKQYLRPRLMHIGRLISLLTFFTEEGLVKKVKEKGVYTPRLGVTSDGKGMKAIAGL